MSDMNAPEPTAIPEQGQIVIDRQRPFVVAEVQASGLADVAVQREPDVLCGNMRQSWNTADNSGWIQVRSAHLLTTVAGR
jgi:hypothetical protein